MNIDLLVCHAPGICEGDINPVYPSAPLVCKTGLREGDVEIRCYFLIPRNFNVGIYKEDLSHSFAYLSIVITC